jgi:hypothetical protein
MPIAGTKTTSNHQAERFVSRNLRTVKDNIGRKINRLYNASTLHVISKKISNMTNAAEIKQFTNRNIQKASRDARPENIAYCFQASKYQFILFS